MANIEYKPVWSEDGQTLSNVLVKDKLETYNVTDVWYDGTPIDDSKLDSDLVYVKYEGKYLVRNFEYGQVLQKDTMQEMRDLNSYEILLLKMGVYKHVQLNGYYEKGDTPSPISYTLSDTEEEDDGGSVVEVGDVKLEHEFENSLNVIYYGITQGQVSVSRIQNIIDKHSSLNNIFTIKFNEGTYEILSPIIIKSGISLVGVGKYNTTIYRSSGNTVLRSGDPVINSIGINEDIIEGSTTIRLNDTSNVNDGDLILIESKVSMRNFWQDTKYGDSKKFNQGELVKVKKVDHGMSEVELESAITFRFNLEDLDRATCFTPNRNSKVNNIGVTTDVVESGMGIGIDISHFEGFEVGEVYTKGFNVAGVRVSLSIGTTIKSIFSEGGDDVVGQNYGLLMYNGSKFSDIGLVEGRGCRHTFAGGSDGRGIPMFNTIDEVRHYKSKVTNLHGIDCHISTAYFTFGHLYSENGISIDGLGHSIETSYNKGGSLYIQYAGGRDLSIRDYTHINPENESHSPDTISKNVKIGNLRILSNGNSFTGQTRDLRLFRHGEGIEILNLELNNLDSELYQSNEDATEESFRYFLINRPIKIGKLKVKGYASIRVASSDVHIEDITMEDCNWEGSQSNSSVGAITIEGVKNVTINKVTAYNTNPNLTFTGTFLRFITSQNVFENIVLRNISYRDGITIYPSALRNTGSNEFQGLVMENINIGGGYFPQFNYLISDVHVSNCKYINGYKLPINVGGEGQVLVKGVGDILEWEDLRQSAPPQSDSTANDVEGIVTDFNSLLSKLRLAGFLEE